MFKEKSSFKYLLYLLQNIEPKSSLSEMPVAVATYSHLSLYLSLSFFLKIYQDGYTNKKYLCRPRPKAQILKIYQLYRRVVQHKVKDIQYISFMPFTYFSNIYIIHFVNTDLIERSKEHRISSQFFLILVIKNMMLVYIEGNFCILFSIQDSIRTDCNRV